MGPSDAPLHPWQQGAGEAGQQNALPWAPGGLSASQENRGRVREQWQFPAAVLVGVLAWGFLFGCLFGWFFVIAVCF